MIVKSNRLTQISTLVRILKILSHINFYIKYMSFIGNETSFSDLKSADRTIGPVKSQKHWFLNKTNIQDHTSENNQEKILELNMHVT